MNDSRTAGRSSDAYHTFIDHLRGLPTDAEIESNYLDFGRYLIGSGSEGSVGVARFGWLGQ